MKRKSSSSPSWTDVKPTVTNMDANHLVKLVADLYRFSKENQTFLHTRFGVGEDPLATYKKTIAECMYPDLFGNKPVHIAKAKKAISAYSKATGDPLGEVELMVTFAEYGNKFTVECGDMDEAFYDSLNSMYRRVIKKVLRLPEEQKDGYKGRLKEIMTSSSGIGWGYHDMLADDYYSAFPERRPGAAVD
ncbi:hypothetical protein [Desulfofustis glycolicus]|nr:hypothetical protein [Desulfofustis glycolicus]